MVLHHFYDSRAVGLIVGVSSMMYTVPVVDAALLFLCPHAALPIFFLLKVVIPIPLSAMFVITWIF